MTGRSSSLSDRRARASVHQRGQEAISYDGSGHFRRRVKDVYRTRVCVDIFDDLGWHRFAILLKIDISENKLRNKRMVMICVLVTLLIVLSYYILFSFLGIESFLKRIIMSSLMLCAQIVLSELFLGLMDMLYAGYIIALNAIVIFVMIFICFIYGKNKIIYVNKHVFRTIDYNIRRSFDIYNLILAVLFVLTYGWIVLCAYYLPARGIDDLSYHLPPILEYIQSHGIRLLPIRVHTSFAFPENAELLFMWPMVFAPTQQLLDGCNVLFVLLSIVTIYAMLRHFSVSREDSLFASFLYALCPVILMQSGTNYIDVIVSLFLLMSLYFGLLFYDNQRIVYLYSAAVSIGMVCGMKYTAIFLTIPIHILILMKIRTVYRWHLFLYFGLILLLCGWWYVRNSILLSDPTYPMNIIFSLFNSGAGGNSGIINLNTIGANIKHWFLRYPLGDIGVGTFDGGFGLVFWGIGFPSWLYVAIYTLFHIKTSETAKNMVLLYLPIGFLLLLVVPKNNIEFAGRFSIFVVAIGMFAMCQMIYMARDKLLTMFVKCLGSLLSIITIPLMTISTMPTYNLHNVVLDRYEENFTSEYKYLINSIPEYAQLRYLWEPFDYITRNGNNGLKCLVVADANYLITAPAFGVNLQNSVMNFKPDNKDRIDAYMYMYAGKISRIFSSNIIPDNIKISDRLNMHDVLKNSDYAIVSHSDNGCILLHKSIISKTDIRIKLQSYYLATWPDAISVARHIMPKLLENIPVITSNHVGYGLRYFDYSVNRTGRVVLTLEGMESILARKMGAKKCYSLGKPLSGYQHTKIVCIKYNEKDSSLYLNTYSNNNGITSK